MRARFFGLAVIFLGLWALPALAQQVVGAIHDEHNAPIADATLVARASDDDSPDLSKATTDANGVYRLTGLKPGTYTLVADAPGFAQAKKPVVITSADTIADFTLAPRPAIQFQAAGVRGLIDPGGYSVPAAAASASGLVTGMADMQRNNNASAADWGCGVEADFKQSAAAGSPEALLRLGEFYLAQRRFQDASPPLKLAADKQRDAGTLRLLAESYEGSGQFVEAASTYLAAAQLDPSEQNLFGAGYELILSGSAESAAASFRNSLSKWPQSYLLWIGSGAAEFLAGHSNLAETALVHAINLKPNEPAGYEYLARVEGGNTAPSPAADDAFRRFAETAPQNPKALYDYALSLRRRNPGNTKIEMLLRQSILLDPAFADAHLALGELLANRGDKANALLQYKQAVDLAPDLAQAHYRLARLYKSNGDQANTSRELAAFEAAKARNKSASATLDLKPFVSMLTAKTTQSCPEEKHTASAADYLRRGIKETSKGEFGNAATDLQTAAKMDASNPQVYFHLGLLLGRITDFRAAETAFQRAIALQPSYAEAYYNLGLTQIANPQSKLDWPAAIASFRSALQYRPSYPEAANYLGVGLMATGDLDGAIAHFQQATNFKPNLAEAHFNLGLALEKKENLAAAESEYRRAEAARPDYPEARVALGKLLLHEAKFSAAEQELKASLRLNPDLSDAHYVLAQLYQAQKNALAAQLEFDQVRDLANRKTDAVQSSRMTNEGLQAAAKGDMTAALQLERQAVQLKPDFGVPHYNLALILADTGDLDGAAREFVKAASLMPASAAPWFALGRVLRRKQDLKGSLAALAWAACLAPNEIKISSELSEVQSDVRQQAAGDQPPVRKPPLGPESDSAASHSAFATDLNASGDRLGAVGELLHVLDLEPANGNARRQLAGVYQELKAPNKAALEIAKADLLANP